MINAFKKFWIKHKIKFIVPVTIILVLIGLTNFYYIFEVTAQSNDECLWVPQKISKDSVAIVFDIVKENGVTWQAGIRDGDQLIAINGIKTKDLIIATKVLDKVTKGDFATYSVLRNGKIFDTKVEVKKLINYGGLGISLLSFLWLIVAFIVFVAKPDGKIQSIFYRVAVLSVLISISNLLYRGAVVQNPIYDNYYLLVIINLLLFFGAIFFPYALIHLFCVFPKEYSIVTMKWFKRIIYGLPTVIFFLTLILRSFLTEFNRIFRIINTTINISLLIGFIIGLVLLFINYLRLKTKRERNSIFIILVAYFVGVVAIIYTNFLAPVIAGIIFNNPVYFTPIILIALLPIAFGYSIFRYSLMDVSYVIKNTIIYGTATITLAAIYFLMIYVIGLSISSAIGTEYQGIIAGVVFVVFAIVFQSTKDRFQDLLTERFYPEQFKFQESLLKFSSDVSSIVGFDNILDSTQQLFIQSLRINRFGLMLRDSKEQVYSMVRQQGLYDTDLKIYDENDEIEKYFLTQISYSKKPFIERNDFENSVNRRFKILLDEEIYTIIPLIIKSKVIGLLLFGLRHSGSQFSGKDLDLLLSAASQTAVSIENARLYESEAEKHKIDRDLENARKIQESLLPKDYPKISGLDIYGAMIPAMQVGGDYYDLIQISDRKLFIVVGDVSGKGLSASFYMSKLQTMIRLYCDEYESPKDILIEINKRIFNEIEKNWFITVSLALIDMENGIIKLCRAGHTPLIKINKNTYELYQSSGVGIGLDKGELFLSSLEEFIVQLVPGDLLFFYSDGVTELMNSKDELYGISRLKKLLMTNYDNDCKAIGKILLTDLTNFQGKIPQYDDITFIVLKINR